MEISNLTKRLEEAINIVPTGELRNLLCDVNITLLSLSNKQAIIKDKNGNPICEGDKFTFKFLEELHKPITLKGSFDYHDDELRWEIDIWENNQYTVLSYISNGTMYDFELLPKD